MTTVSSSLARACGHTLALVSAGLLLTACGISQTSTSPGIQPAAQFKLQLTTPSASFNELQAVPAFHVAPVWLDEPTDVEADDATNRGLVPPHVQYVPEALSGLSTRRLTWQVLDDARRNGIAPKSNRLEDLEPTPMASGTAVATYTPAQIRAAYNLPALPSSFSNLTASQAAQLGAGQTIYLVDAKGDPNAAAELAAFNQKFGLPNCTTVNIATNATLPLASAPTNGCTFSVVYSTSSGGMTSTVPAYDSGWATEIAMDVQWSHATAPFARIVLIEAPDATVPSLLGAVALANSMGPGSVSMSFGTPEGGFTADVDSNFTGKGMSYTAAAGDNGAGVEWPAVSTRVLAVGGTSLTFTGSGPRTETVWSGSGGGVSQYTTAPAWQTTKAVPGLNAPSFRSVSDVAFNSDPSTGQYVVTIAPNSTTSSWVSAGGTSIAAPQWAGILAIANAQRALQSQGTVTTPQTVLYGSVGASASLYSAAFLDIKTGSDGTCPTCSATTGYDLPTGLGTPNATSVVSALVSGTASQPVSPGPTAPVVTSASVSGVTGTPLSFTVKVVNTNPVSFSLMNAPAGMVISSSGNVSWPAPVAGQYSITVKATDTQSGLTGSGTLTLTISGPVAPVVSSGSVQGIAGLALNFTASTTDTNAVVWSLSGAPTGMTISSSGTVSWASAVAGTYSVSVNVKDTTSGLVGQGRYSVVISPPAPPSVQSATINGTAGSALSFSVMASDPNPLTYTLSGAPSGMTIASNGVVSWSSPTAGTYPVKVSATDSKTGLTGQGTYTVQITASGPVISGTGYTGPAGTKMSVSISITDSTSNTVSVSIAGVPNGMALGLTGTTLTLSWANPLVGNWAIKVTAKDGNGATAVLTLPITITAR